jgi:hypothetical protein
LEAAILPVFGRAEALGGNTRIAFGDRRAELGELVDHVSIIHDWCDTESRLTWE